MAHTQIFHFHPGFTPSKTNAAMVQAAAEMPGVEVHKVYDAYPDSRIDVAAETRRLLDADRIVFQFPLHWYSTPSLMKEWQDQVLTYMFYIKPEIGARLLSKPVMVAVTAGNVPSAYGPGGVNLFPLQDILKPLQSTASRCGLAWSEPFLSYGADKLSEEERSEVASVYRAKLEAWIEQMPPARRG